MEHTRPRREKRARHRFLLRRRNNRYTNDSSVGCAFHDYSVVDKVVLPPGLAEGEYLLSWRWDCE